jgi:hypothetical protein
MREPSMDIIIRKIKDYERDKCLEIARNLPKWFNEKAPAKMATDLELHKTQGDYQNN